MLASFRLKIFRSTTHGLVIIQSRLTKANSIVSFLIQSSNENQCYKRNIATTAVLANQQFGYKLKNNVRDCYSLLNVPEDCTDEELRDAYLKLAKIYHPDSGTSTADARKFSQVQNAYQAARTHRESPESEIDMEEEEEDEGIRVRHTVPQHRQYLTYEGVGFGSPGQRQRQYQQYKVMKATEKVHDHRVQKWASQKEGALVVREKTEAKKAKISNAIDRLVEDLIQESMKSGDFDNLPGMGKPLNFSERNPLVDSMTHNLNKILINNGFTPEWIMLEKEIRDEMKKARGNLAKEVKRLGLPPFESETSNTRWILRENIFREAVTNINQLIVKFNMVVPIMEKQMIPFNVEKEVERVKVKYDEYVNFASEDWYGTMNSEQYQGSYGYKEEPLRWRDVWKNIRDSFK
ncbi:hypothetical protein FSP39_015853 [Pinctada imbricata]|uniref:J domain-containing protein n=1 Tax=Pinctada imbricata TaxID=66713 RepID=A0AA88YMQ2_PINIB|nr:hypothetical protein FSP39_015853 [Pinctada imbricata]